jgi:hypothetical protein
MMLRDGCHPVGYQSFLGSFAFVKIVIGSCTAVACCFALVKDAKSYRTVVEIRSDG